MRALKAFVKQWLIPGSMPFLFVGVMVGALLLNAGSAAPVAGRIWLSGLAMLYWLLSLPVVAGALIERMGRRYAVFGRTDVTSDARTLIVVGNGSVHYTDGTFSADYLTRRSVFCVFEAARLHALLTPDLVVTTGGAGHPGARPEAELMRDLLIERGVPAGKVVVESQSRTTSEQVANVLALLAERQVRGPLVVVTTSAHMPRVAALFAERGVARILPAITPDLRYDEGMSAWRRWWPAMSALTGSASAMYELMAAVLAGVPPVRRPS